MKNLNEILNEVKEDEMKMLYYDNYITRKILKDIDKWLDEETKKQDYLEEKFRK